MATTRPNAITIVQQLYGVRFTHRTNHLTSVIGVSVVKILNNNPERTSMIVTNNSLNTMYIHNENTVAATLGILLQPGATITFNIFDDGLLPTGDWYAIASGAGSNITVTEIIVA
jgi:hypothetical protein